MTRYIAWRLGALIPLVLGISVLSYALLSLAPGDAVSMLIDPQVGSISQEEVIARKQALGLDEPLPVRYVHWLGEAVRGNLGYSIANGRPVLERVGERLGGTLQLMFAALGLAMVVGIPLGVLTALKPGSLFDRLSAAASFFVASVPTFFIGLGLIYLLSLKIDLFPTGGIDTIGQPFTVPDRLRHLALPAVVLSLSHVAELLRYTRASQIEALRQEYIRTARAKGLGEARVIFVHALRNALLPVITVIGLAIPGLMGGTLITETIFQWPGLGSLSLEALRQRDYPVVMGVTLVLACAVVLVNLATDLVYAVVDPQIRYE